MANELKKLNSKDTGKKRGGARPGSGRPAGAPSYVMRLRLPIVVFDHIKRLGGDIWVKRTLIKAINEVSKSQDIC